jgi:hypothetical protein
MPRTPEEMQERLDRLGEGIESAREKAKKDDLLPEDEPEDREPTLADPEPTSPGDEGLPGSATG